MVILFDGVCNMCNRFVQFVLKRDKTKIFQFASLQSEYGAGLPKHFNLSLANFDTVILYDGEKIYTQSDAVIKVLSNLNGIWKCASILKIIPGFIRNAIYRLMARNRYKLFGKSEQCMVPTIDVKDRFVDNTKFIPHQD
jgi:predicted DCC family thiol-disulfide oxidoreductase YuxK